MASAFSWRSGWAAACLGAVVGAAVPADAQSVGNAEPPPQQGARFPDIFGIPSAFPAPSGTGYVGLVLVNPRRDAPDDGSALSKVDGDVAAGYTFGNPVRGISVHLGVTSTSLKGFGEDGAFNASLSRALFVGETTLTFAGISASNVGAWGDAANSPPAYSAYVSHLFTLPVQNREMPVQITVGYGDQIASDNQSRVYDRVPFAGVGFGVTPNLSVSLAGTPNEIYSGVSFGFDRLPKWGFSLGVFDVTDAQNSRQMALSLSRSF